MLQSLKRIHAVDSKHPKLHSCLIRFHEFVSANKSTWDPSVQQVVAQESERFFAGKDPQRLNKEFLEANPRSLRAAFESAKVLYRLDAKNQSQAINLVTNIDNKFEDVNIEVSNLLSRYFDHVLYVIFMTCVRATYIYIYSRLSLLYFQFLLNFLRCFSLMASLPRLSFMLIFFK